MKPEIRRAAIRRVMRGYWEYVLAKKSQPQQQQQSESKGHRRARIRKERDGMFALVKRGVDE